VITTLCDEVGVLASTGGSTVDDLERGATCLEEVDDNWRGNAAQLERRPWKAWPFHAGSQECCVR